MGTFTGQYQAGWNVTGNNDYVVFGGEFPRVNGVAQQGLVRFAKRPIAPKTEGPRFAATPFVPTLVADLDRPRSGSAGRPASTGTTASLTYKVYPQRRSAPRAQTTGRLELVERCRTSGFVDTGLTPGRPTATGSW